MSPGEVCEECTHVDRFTPATRYIDQATWAEVGASWPETIPLCEEHFAELGEPIAFAPVEFMPVLRLDFSGGGGIDFVPGDHFRSAPLACYCNVRECEHGSSAVAMVTDADGFDVRADLLPAPLETPFELQTYDPVSGSWVPRDRFPTAAAFVNHSEGLPIGTRFQVVDLRAADASRVVWRDTVRA